MFKLSNVLLNPKKAERHPFEILFVGFFYVSISLLLSLWIFPDYSSLFMVFLSVISCLYIVQGVLIKEEKKEKNENRESWLLKEHSKTLWFFLLLFLGFVLAFTFWTIVLPDSLMSEAFGVQKNAFDDIRSITGKSVQFDDFSAILFNNLKVLLFSLILAMFYGAGSIFILVWNASIMGFVIGNLARNVLGLTSLPHIFMKYFLHGIPEILAYLSAALAGSILFISIIRGDMIRGKTKRTLIDILTLILISVFLLVVAALIEAYFSPFI